MMGRGLVTSGESYEYIKSPDKEHVRSSHPVRSQQSLKSEPTFYFGSSAPLSALLPMDGNLSPIVGQRVSFRAGCILRRTLQHSSTHRVKEE